MTYSNRKVGGIRFIRIGRLNLSLSMARKAASAPLEYRKRNGSTREAFDLIGALMLAPLVAGIVVHLLAGLN